MCSNIFTIIVVPMSFVMTIAVLTFINKQMIETDGYLTDALKNIYLNNKDLIIFKEVLLSVPDQ